MSQYFNAKANLMLRRVILYLALICLLALIQNFGSAAPSQKSEPSFNQVVAIDSVAKLAELPVPDRAQTAVALSANYAVAGDNGGGWFAWQPDDQTSPDEVFEFASNHAISGRWVRQSTGAGVSPEMAGAKGDGASDDQPAFERLVSASLSRGAFTIKLSPGKRYYLAHGLDLSRGATGLSMEGPAAASHIVRSKLLSAPMSRLELNPSNSAPLKLGDSQAVRDLLIWRHGLEPRPKSLADVRRAITGWKSEDGVGLPLSLAIDAPFDDNVVDGVSIVGFNTGILARGSRFKLRHCLIDAAGVAVRVSGSKDTSLIFDVQARSLWSADIVERDRLGDAGYRPGTAFLIEKGADGLQMNSVMAIGWVNGISLQGASGADDWLISILQPNIETPPNDNGATAAISTSGGVRRVTIIDPRIVVGDGHPVGLDFGHAGASAGISANNNVTVIGGVVEVDGKQGTAVLIRQGSTGAIIGTTFAQNGITPICIVLPGAGAWMIDHPQLLGVRHAPWLIVSTGAKDNIRVDGVTPEERSQIGYYN